MQLPWFLRSQTPKEDLKSAEAAWNGKCHARRYKICRLCCHHAKEVSAWLQFMASSALLVAHHSRHPAEKPLPQYLQSLAREARHRASVQQSNPDGDRAAARRTNFIGRAVQSRRRFRLLLCESNTLVLRSKALTLPACGAAASRRPPRHQDMAPRPFSSSWAYRSLRSPALLPSSEHHRRQIRQSLHTGPNPRGRATDVGPRRKSFRRLRHIALPWRATQ